MVMTANKIEDLLANVFINKKTGCHEWLGGTDKDGYGITRYQNRTWKMHRLAYTHIKGKIPKGFIVMHSCDNPCCCNIDHLSIGTSLDNNRDRELKGRGGLYKVTKKQVIEIRRLYSLGNMSQLEISKLFTVSSDIVWNIVHNYTWKYI